MSVLRNARDASTMPPFGRLILLGGPSCAGKSHLIDRIQRGECPPVCAAMGIDRPGDWASMSAKKYFRNPFDRYPRLLLHYDCYGQSTADSGFYLLEETCIRFTDVCVLTLQTEADLLGQRTTTKLWNSRKAVITKPHRVRTIAARIERLKKQRRHYADGAFVSRLYQAWFRAVDNLAAVRHWTVDTLEIETLRLRSTSMAFDSHSRRAA